MLFTKTFDFLTPADYVFDPGVIEITAGTVSLKAPYATSSPYITTKYVQASALSLFAASIVAAGNDAVKFVLLKNDIPYWWNGTAWAISTGYDMSNTVAEVLTNIATLFTSDEVAQVKVRAYLHSEDGSTTPALSLISLKYTFAGVQSNLVRVVLYDWSLDGQGAPKKVPFKIIPKLSKPGKNDGGVVSMTPIIVTPNDSGYWEVPLFVQLNGQAAMYKVVMEKKELSITVPASETVRLSSLLP